MTNLIKIDKRKKSEGYCLVSGDGFTHIIQGGNGGKTNVMTLLDSDLQNMITDLERIFTERSAQHCKGLIQ
jgi:hypothetical protein